MCFGCSKEPSHWDSSFEYLQHMFGMRNEENRFPKHTLIWRPGLFCIFMLWLMLIIVLFSRRVNTTSYWTTVSMGQQWTMFYILVISLTNQQPLHNQLPSWHQYGISLKTGQKWKRMNDLPCLQEVVRYYHSFRQTKIFSVKLQIFSYP